MNPDEWSGQYYVFLSKSTSKFVTLNAKLTIQTSKKN